MADPDPYTNPDPYASPSPVTVQAPPQDYGAPGAYDPMLQRYRTAFQEREKQRESVEAKQQLNTDQMSTLLEDAAKAIRKNREGRSNLPMMAFGAGMMGTPGDFGTQVGAGLRAMIPAVEHQRKDEDQTEVTLANLGTKAGEIRDAPLKTKLDYLKALQLGDVATIRAIETAQIRASAQQAKTDTKQGTLDLNTQKAHAQVLQKATEAAMKHVADLDKDNDFTPEERQQLYRDTLKQQLTFTAGGAGIQLNDEFINKALQMPMPSVGSPANLFPKPEEMKAEGERLGLPEMPRTYDAMGSKDRAKLRAEQNKAYTKESAKWDEQSSIDKGNDDLMREAETIIREKPDLMGLIAGRGWDVSTEAVRLKTILRRLEVTNVPKGQGQITDYERELFREAGVAMTQNPQAALQTLQAMRAANNRSSEQRTFMDNYFKTYRTLEGAASKWEEYTRSNGGSYVTMKDGKLVPNANRMPPEIYFKHQRLGSDLPIAKGPDGKWYVMRDGKPEPL